MRSNGRERCQPGAASSTRQLRGKRTVLAGAAALTISVSGWPAVASASTSPPSLASVTIKVATYPLEGDDVLLKAAGLYDTPYNVQYEYLASGALQSEAVNAGTADIGRASGISNALLAASGDKNWLSVASLRIGTDEQDTVVMKSSGITSVAQLKGKQVGYVPDTTPQYFLDKQLQAAGLNWNSIHAVPFTQPTSGLAALIAGDISAFATFGNVATAESKGATILASGGPYLSGVFGGLQATYNEYKGDLNNSAKDAAIADFISRVDTALAWARSHPTQYASILAKNLNEPPSIALADFEAGEESSNSWVGPNSAAAVTSEQGYASAFESIGVIHGALNITGTFTNQLSSAIAADEAKYQTEFPSYFVVPAYAKSGEPKNS
ncbi:MAG TPA: ABC transporter substrate-binding protein [Acidimicrobiales bacterium]|nr:ABC transporter substrate-binding protein [Acidimicrobiales bacterium]